MLADGWPQTRTARDLLQRRGMTYRSILSTFAAATLSLAGCAADTGAPPTGRAHAPAERERPVYAVDISVWSGPITDDEVDCWWDDGVRHVIVGMQDTRIARQQLDMALARGMSVDAYVYLYWDGDMRAQVEDALRVLDEYPIGRVWLDAEEHPGGLGRAAIGDRLDQALDACGDVPCGIYTAAWWWNPFGPNDRFADVPLWYAHYDDDPLMSTWGHQSFGGWTEPWGKQWMGDIYVCGIDVDQNTIYTAAEPTRAHPEPEPAPAGAPRTPTGLYPDGVSIRPWQDARPLWSDVPGATEYELEIEHYASGRWRPYWTYHPTDNARRFSPIYDDRAYRFRARAGNGAGWSEWSDWARFDFGAPADAPPLEPPADDPPTDDPPADDPPADDP
ncbi:MAG TPA: GH25 family lysozyme, partial [Sandaracinaceae bacterium LLY-WYZ-13_1]|nr:GH25 family lysozyme [Sandaracinaceae bacterium LLY-WYZ-13_1]